MRKIIFIFGLVGLLALSACHPSNPSGRKGLPENYTLAYQEIYGHCYDSLPNVAVVALDLYSEGLELDKNHRIKGTGYNLYLSDIFVPDSLLEPGLYRSDTTAAPFTFLPGMNFEGYPHGMYLLNIEERQIVHIQMPKQFKKAQALGWLTAIAGAAAEKSRHRAARIPIIFFIMTNSLISFFHLI